VAAQPPKHHNLYTFMNALLPTPKFHKQETRYSCLPACLRIVFSSFNLDISESELRRLCDCTPFGTEALKAVDAARQLGFSQSAKYTLSIDELETLVATGNYPIVLVNLIPIDGIVDSHALVVIEMNRTIVRVFDPLCGERVLPYETFFTAWAMMHSLVILIER
jgi:ABC-type bacteriocin/lantibiotic exporter with double-glycine peptidase domain